MSDILICPYQTVPSQDVVVFLSGAFYSCDDTLGKIHIPRILEAQEVESR